MKIKAALEALKFVKDGMVLGIGSGSTVREFIKLLGNSDIDTQKIISIPSSLDTENMLIENGMVVGSFNQHPIIDLTVDGADRVDEDLNVIKGGGGALLREKIIAAAAKVVVIIVDESKLVSELGGSFPIPVEVIPYAMKFVARKLQAISGEPKLRMASDKLGPTVTDNGNIILDTDFQTISNPLVFEGILNNIPGVMENGLFPNNLVSKVIIASEKKIIVKEKN
ncbi:MAG: ribose-5-phosphate isomerase RpiA [Candidatus Heimdallarchaeota archaeon]|nr:ribose-5-phosphate isomerase RpiA [Candidatus Heimdallarchaeota archaeon]MBY8994798.1 ribose-5-phosphate isomerase RpiA [Candidatus Heimdallarchaeota archaeon]